MALLWWFICLSLFTAAYSQTPMVCTNRAAGQVFQLPLPKECDFRVNLTTDLPVPTRYSLFKHNLIEYQTEGWLCKATTQSVRLLTYFFNDEHLKEFDQKEVLVDAATCKFMIDSKVTPVGPLSKTQTGLWTTNHPLEYKTPKGGFECCAWHTYSVTNYYLVPATVYKRHDHSGFRSTAADVSHCPPYLTGCCQLGNQVLIWSPEQLARCQYIPYQVLDGVTHGGMWISNDSQLALTNNQNRTVSDCGQDLLISDQGVAYTILSSSKPDRPSWYVHLPYHHSRQRTTRSLPTMEQLHDPDLNLPGYDPIPPEITINLDSDGPVPASILAAWTQALAYTNRVMVTRAFEQTWLNSCREMKSTAALLRNFLIAAPTGAMRTLLQDPLLYAKAGNGFVEVWKCVPINSTGFTFLKQTTDCTEEIPVDFTLSDGGNHSGYLDPVDLIIRHQGTPASCDLQPTVPLKLAGQLQIYRRLDGTLYPADNVSSLQVLHYHTHSDSHFSKLLIPKIYTPIAAYTWDELAPSEDTNHLLATAAAQAEVVQLLTAPILYQAAHRSSPETDILAANIVARGVRRLKHFIITPFHAWVFLTCLLVNVYITYRILQKTKCLSRSRSYASALHQRYREYRRRPATPSPEQAIRLSHLRDALHEAEAAHLAESEPAPSNAAATLGVTLNVPESYIQREGSM